MTSFFEIKGAFFSKISPGFQSNLFAQVSKINQFAKNYSKSTD